MIRQTSSAAIAALTVLGLGACASPAGAGARTPGPLGIDLGPATRVVARAPLADAAQTAAGQRGVRQVADATRAAGVVNKIDAPGRRLNLTHEPIPAIGWPSMTMDFPVAASVDLTGLRPGARVTFTIEKGKNGMYEVQSVTPVSPTR